MNTIPYCRAERNRKKFLDVNSGVEVSELESVSFSFNRKERILTLLPSVPTMPPTTPQSPRSRRWAIELIVGGVILVALIAVLLAPKPAPKTSNMSPAPKPGITSTPLVFSDFSGQVTKIDGSNLTVLFRGIGSDGQLVERSYQVIVDPTTKLQARSGTGSVATPSDIPLTEVKVDDQVYISGPGNLATVTSFTAQKILVSR